MRPKAVADGPPDPGAASNPAEFVAVMNQLRLWAGQPSLRRLEQLGGLTRAASGHTTKALPASTISYVLSGKAGARLPRLKFVERYVASCLTACGHPVAQGGGYLRRWTEAWRALASEHATATPPSPVPEATDEGARRQLPMDIAEFTGRVGDLDRLHAIVAAANPDAPTVVAIEGMAGVGKTRLAVHAAHQLVNRGRYADIQLWADLRGFDPAGPPVEPAAVLDRFLRLLGVPATHIPAALDDRAALYRDRLAGRHSLVLLDNVAGEEQLRPLLPAAGTCLVLVTSRRSLATADGVETLPLDTLTPADAVALLTRVAGAERFAEDPESAAHIAGQCGYLPIAISIAARRFRSRAAWTTAHLIARLDRVSRHSEQVHASFALSYRELSAPAARVFRLLGLHPGPDFTAHSAAALAGLAVEEAEALLDELLDEHLLQQTVPDRYHFHDLLRDYAMARVLAEEPDRRPAVHRLLTWFLHTADAAADRIAPHRRRTFEIEPTTCAALTFCDHDEALAWCVAGHATLVDAVRLAVEYDLAAVAWQLPAVLLHYFYLRSHWDDWVATHTVALEAARGLGDPYGQAKVLNGLGVAYSDRRQYPSAMDCYRQALALFTSVGDAYGQAWVRNNLGVAHVDLGQLPAAVEEFNRALPLYRDAADIPGEGICLNNLGDARRRAGETAQAARHLQDALAIQRRTADHASERFTLHTLADLHRDQGEYDKAVRYYREAHTLSVTLGDQWGAARTLNHLGDTLAAMNDAESAGECWQRALTVLSDLGSPEADDLRARLTEAR
jgi:tetratricopeptide (TPR) repeat protein